MGPAHPFNTGITGSFQQRGIVAGHGIVVQPLGSLARRQLTDQRAVLIQQAFIINKDNQFFRLQRSGHLATNILVGQVEGVAGG